MDEPDDPNLARLEEAALRLGPLADELVLVGGCVTGLLITDPGAAPVRPTVDVDLVVDALRYAEFQTFERRLRARGFEQRPGDEEAPICRWWHGRLRIDVLPVGEFLGFTNPWYASAVEHAVERVLPSGRRIRHAPSPLAPQWPAAMLAAPDQPDAGPTEVGQ